MAEFSTEGKIDKMITRTYKKSGETEERKALTLVINTGGRYPTIHPVVFYEERAEEVFDNFEEGDFVAVKGHMYGSSNTPKEGKHKGETFYSVSLTGKEIESIDEPEHFTKRSAVKGKNRKNW